MFIILDIVYKSCKIATITFTSTPEDFHEILWHKSEIKSVNTSSFG